MILNILNLQLWYTGQIQLLCNWLGERLDHSLHFVQCTCLAHVVKVKILFIYLFVVIILYQDENKLSFRNNFNGFH